MRRGRTEVVSSDLSNRSGRDPLPRTEPGAGDGEGGAPHHDVRQAVDDGADVAGDGEAGEAFGIHGQTSETGQFHYNVQCHDIYCVKSFFFVYFYSSGLMSVSSHLMTVPKAMKPVVTTMASLREYPRSQTIGMKPMM